MHFFFRSIGLALACLFTVSQSLVSAQNNSLVFSYGSTDMDVPYALAIAENGDMLVAGSFKYNGNFGTHGVSKPVPGKGRKTGYLARFDARGTAIWVNDLQSGGYGEVTRIAMTPEGNVVVVGKTNSGPMDLDPRQTEQHIIPASKGVNNTVFLAQYSGKGTLMWSRYLTEIPNSLHEAFDLAVSPDGNIFFSGSYKASSEFRFDQELTLPGRAQMVDCFIVSLDGKGKVNWFKTFGGEGQDIASQVRVGPKGNIYVSGNYQYAIEFSPEVAISTGTAEFFPDAFIARFSPDGAPETAITWGLAATNSNFMGSEDLKDMAVDKNGHVYVTGGFEDSLAADKATLLRGKSSSDTYLIRFDLDNKKAVWAKVFSGSGYDSGHALAVADDRVFVLGSTVGDMEGAKGHGNNEDYFLLSVSTADGAATSKECIGGTAMDKPKDVLVNQGNLYICGTFKESLQVDGKSLRSNGSGDALIIRRAIK